MNKQNDPINNISLAGAVIVLSLILTLIAVSLIVFEAPPHIPILLAVMFLIGYGMWREVEWYRIQTGIVDGVRAGIIPILIFIFIGVLISVWISAGTIPTMIYYSFHMISLDFFLPSIFIVTAIVGVCIGSSLTTVSTIGVSFMALGGFMDMNPAVTAGAIVSGAMLGDKMSPLSDTTNLASSVAKVDLFTHIRHMIWTAIPMAVITFIIYLVLGSGSSTGNGGLDKMMNDLHDHFSVHPISLLPALVIVILAVKRIPAIPAMMGGIVSGFVVILITQPGYSVSDYMTFMQDGFTSHTGNSDLDEMLTRGGIQEMMWPISLLILTLSMGGLLSTLGVINKILSAAQELMNTTGKLVLSTVLAGIGINVTLGEQYMSVILPGEAFVDKYERMGLARENLSRTLENAGTLMNPLIPYGVCGVFMASVLDVDVFAYLPYAIFCLLGPVFALLYGFTGFTMKKNGE
ncbi:Na+/H+ antiporter NhaC [Alteribacillus iranensis]|uniref:Putative tyrosine permease, NhaC family n=1 Tax=Alteribacillus iranensis TaxID=930128 RepID=A0A1I2FCL0_9BACI|nr:Na+/H+ antiporter NhaC [Alteribacillus iranensis]SFF02507.1 putative tyrosine permease, NhaC family [Alteribacillus iranensis]